MPRLRRANAVVTAVAWALALAAVSVYLIVSPLLPPRVHVRWSEAASDAQRIHIEQELGLTSREHLDGRTWSYVLRDPSTTNIGRLIRDPLVEDTHHIDRATATLSPEVSGQPVWVRYLAQSPVVQAYTPWLQSFALMLGIIGLAGSWPIWRRVVPGVWRGARHSVRTARGFVRASRVWRATQAGVHDLQVLSPRGRAMLTLALIMLVSQLLRVFLVASGGQFYWGDESRYGQARDIAETLEHGDIRYAFNRMGNGQHPLFSVVGVVPALVERMTHQDSRIPGAFFAAFSTLNIGLLALLARRSGATHAEALVAGALLAMCSSMFYYARHLLPYDVSMSFGLLALYLGIGYGRRSSSVLCGIAAACAFLTYTGYWTLGGAALVIHVINAEGRRAALRRALFGSIGLVATIGVVTLGSAAAGENLTRALVEFSNGVDQGDFNEGWRLPWEYLWHAEHFMMVLWVLGLAWAIATLRSRTVPGSARLGLLGVAFVYLSLVLTSVVLHEFVVYGRLARQVVPFLCLLTASALYHAALSLSPRARWLFARAVAIVLLVQTGFNFTTPLRQSFPAEFLRDAQHDRIPAGADLIAINAKHLYPGPEPVTLPPRYTVLRQTPHPLQFLPYQYEGYTPAQRSALRSADIEMKLIVPDH